MKGTFSRVFHLIAWPQVDWGRLIVHELAGLLATIGTTGMSGGDMKGAVRIWFFAALIYAGGYIQKGSKDPDGQDDPPFTSPVETK